jgi:hypothetical protein
MTLLAERVNALGQLAQASEIEQLRGMGRGKRGWGIHGQIGGVESDGGVVAIGEANDDVRVLTVADANDGQMLPAERVMGMRDRHESQGGLGRRGSAL